MIRRATALVVAVGLVALAAPAARAYLKLGTSVNGRVISLQWTDLPVTYYVTNRDVPGVTASQLQSTIERAFDTWTGTDGIRLSSRFGGYTAAEPFEDDFTTVIGFQSRPDLDRTLGATTFIVDTFSGDIAEADIFLNSDFDWSVATSGQTGRYDVESIVVHELGHLLGLGHSAIGETEKVDEDSRRVLGAEAVMFPIAYPSGNILDRTLKADDIAGIRDLYGTTDSDLTLGSISGTVRLGSAGVFGAHVTAFNTSTGELVGNFVLNEQGSFAIASLTPGLYVVRVEPLDDADIDSFFDEDTDVNIDFAPTYYPRLVVVPPGGSSGSIAITVRPR